MSRLRRPRPFPFCGFAVFGLAWALAVPAVRAQEFRGNLSTRFRTDVNPQGRDWDALGFANLSLTDLIKGHLDVKLSGWGLWDINGNDSYDNALNDKQIRISEAYAELRNYGALSRLRLGRMRIYDVDYLQLDGAFARFREDRPLSFFLFGGREVTFYQDHGDNWAGGGGLVWKPSWRSTHQLDLYGLLEGQLYVASAWRWTQYWGQGWRTTSRLRELDGEVRDWRGHLSKLFESIGVAMDVDYIIQPRTLGHGDQSESPSVAELSRILGARSPYQRMSVNFNKYFGENWVVNAGGTVRRRIKSGADDTYNSLDSTSAQLSLTRMNLFIKGLDVTFAGEWIQNDSDAFHSLSGDIRYTPNKQWEFGAGLSYSRYTLDPVDFRQDNWHQPELDLLLQDLHIPVYFLEARWKPNATYDMRAEVSYTGADKIRGGGFAARLGVNYHIRKSLAPDEKKADTKEAAKEATKEPVQP